MVYVIELLTKITPTYICFICTDPMQSLAFSLLLLEKSELEQLMQLRVCCKQRRSGVAV